MRGLENGALVVGEIVKVDEILVCDELAERLGILRYLFDGVPERRQGLHGRSFVFCFDPQRTIVPANPTDAANELRIVAIAGEGAGIMVGFEIPFWRTLDVGTYRYPNRLSVDGWQVFEIDRRRVRGHCQPSFSAEGHVEDGYLLAVRD